MNKENVVHQFTKEESKELRFVQKACGKDKARPVLNGMYFENGKAVAADGFRMHISKAPTSFTEEYPGEMPGIFKPVRADGKTKMVPATPSYVEIEKIDGMFPRWQDIVPKKKPVFRYSLNKKFIKDLADMPGSEMLIFEFFDFKSPCRVFNFNEDYDRAGRGDPGDSSGNEAIIMPMWLPDHLQIDSEAKEVELSNAETEAFQEKIEELQHKVDRYRKMLGIKDE